MLTLRTLAIVIAGAGVFAGLPLTPAQACDDDRYPCPIRVPQEVDAPAQAAPSAQPQKKASHAARPSAARPSEKAQAKREAPPAARAKPSKPAAPEQAADSIAQKAAEAPPALVPSPPADQPLNAASRGESPVAAAGTAWPVLPTTEGASAPGAAPAATSADATEAAKTAAATTAVTNAVKVVDPNEVNDLDRAAAASVQAESSWLTYLLLMLATALAAASAFWFFARRAAPRVRMSNS
jgi:hypothetical protein